MSAQFYRLDDTRLQRNSPMPTESCSPTQLALDGSALLLAATSFWVTYGEALALFHHRLLSQPCLPDWKLPKGKGSSLNWRYDDA